MPLDPDLVHPSLAGVASALVRHGSVEGLDLPTPQRLVAESTIALLGSARMPDEMREYVGAMNAALDADARLRAMSGSEERLATLVEVLRRMQRATRSLESARSGMAGDIALDEIALARDDALALASAV